MTEVPTPSGVISPDELIVATEVFALIHGSTPAGVPEPFRVVEDPIQTEVVPVIVGDAFTV